MTKESVKEDKKKDGRISDARKKAAERVKGRNTDIAAVCFLSDLGLIVFAVVTSVILSVETEGDKKVYIISICCAAALALWLVVRAFTGELKRRVFEKVLTNKKAEKRSISFGLYIFKYITVLLSGCLLFVPAIVVNAVYIGAENEKGSVAERMRQSRTKSKGFAKKAMLLTLGEIYKAILPALAILGAVSLCLKISSPTARAIVAAAATLAVAAVSEFLYARYRASLLMLYEGHKKEKEERENKDNIINM